MKQLSQLTRPNTTLQATPKSGAPELNVIHIKRANSTHKCNTLETWRKEANCDRFKPFYPTKSEKTYENLYAADREPTIPDTEFYASRVQL